jgi:hypothetical protein
MTHVLMLLSSAAGFAALALATERQQDELFGCALPTRATRALRAAGWGLLAACLAVAVGHWGWGLGLVAYSGHTSLAAGLVYIGLVAAARKRGRR